MADFTANLLTLTVAVLGAIALRGLLPIGDPTRRYRPTWIVHLVVGEMAAPLAVITAALTGVLWLLAGCSLGVSTIVGAVTITALFALRMRARWLAKRLEPLVDGPVPPALGIGRVWPRAVPFPPGVDLELRQLMGQVVADVIRLDPAPGGPVRVAVYVHGGGWVSGGPQRAARDLYRVLAERGWVVVAIRYPFTPLVRPEDQIETVLDAVRRVRSGAATGGAAPSSVVLIGGSAGAHLAAMATLTGRAAGERVDAFVGLYGIYDLANRHRTRAPWQLIEDSVVGTSVDEAPERYRRLSPIDHVAADGPPTLLVHGCRDTLVPVGESRLFADELRAVGAEVERVEVGAAEHAFDAFTGITSRTVAVVVATWLDRYASQPTAR